MKKNIYLLLPLSIIATSCTPTNVSDISILCPTGAPSLAFYNYAEYENFETNSSPANIVSSMTENGTDFVVIDTIKGVSAINNGAPYKLAATITFGNFYLVSTGNDQNNTLDADDVIISFGKGQTPEKVFNLLYGQQYTNIHYVDNLQMAGKCLISKKTIDNSLDVDYVFVAEPVLTNCLKQNSDASIYHNIQELYKEKTNSEMIQASIFIKNTVNEDTYRYHLDSISKDIQKVLEEPTLLNKTVNSIGDEQFTNKFSIGANVAISCFNNNNSIGLGFKYAYENKQAIVDFCSLFNMEVTDNEILQIK